MSWLYLPGRVEAFSQADSLDGGLSAMSKTHHMQSMYSRPASVTDTLTMLPSGMIATHSTGIPGLDAWIFSLRDSRASRSVWPGEPWQRVTLATVGLPQSALLAKYDLLLHSWRTYPALFQNLISDEFLGIWPRSGTMLNGELYRRPALEHRTRGKDYGWLPTPRVSRSTYNYSHGKVTYNLPGMARFNQWPTPLASDSKGSLGLHRGNGKKKYHLANVVKLRTPVSTDWKNRETSNQTTLQNQIGGHLNPDWVEWLMGWPIGWTDLQPLAMDRFQQWLEQHGIC